MDSLKSMIARHNDDSDPLKITSIIATSGINFMIARYGKIGISGNELIFLDTSVSTSDPELVHTPFDSVDVYKYRGFDPSSDIPDDIKSDIMPEDLKIMQNRHDQAKTGLVTGRQPMDEINFAGDPRSKNV